MMKKEQGDYRVVYVAAILSLIYIIYLMSQKIRLINRATQKMVQSQKNFTESQRNTYKRFIWRQVNFTSITLSSSLLSAIIDAFFNRLREKLIFFSLSFIAVPFLISAELWKFAFDNEFYLLNDMDWFCPGIFI